MNDAAPADPIAVTGLGCLGSFGLGEAALAAALASGRAATSPIDRAPGWHRPGAAELVAACPQLDLTPWVSPMAARRMSSLSHWAVAMARLALERAGLSAVDVAGDRTALALATTFGPAAYTEQLVRQIQGKGGTAASPFLFTDCVANAAGGQVAIDLGARGPNLTICQRQAGPLLAVIAGADELSRGRADRCLVGGVDEMTSLVHTILDRFRALARPQPPRREAARPFAAGRNGALAGEGATVLVLERESAARRRGARVLARVVGSARANDPTASRAGFGRDAVALAATARRRLGAALDRVDAIVSGAAGTVAGDLLEAQVLQHLCPRRPPVVAPKAVHGEWGGGTLAAALLAVQGATFGDPWLDEVVDPGCGIRPYAGTLAARTVLVQALAAGGAAAWLLLERP